MQRRAARLDKITGGGQIGEKPCAQTRIMGP